MDKLSYDGPIVLAVLDGVGLAPDGPGNAVAKAKTLAKHIKPSAILQINNLILQIDYDIKSGKMNAENAMYFLVLQICQLVKGEK